MSAGLIKSLSPNSARLGSRAIARGVVGDALDGRSRDARFLKQAEAELLQQLSGSPSFVQSQLVRRAARLMLQLDKLDGGLFANARLDAATLQSLSVTLSQILSDLGLQPPRARGRHP